ncbi:hypothetical protein ACJMK2_023739 [Sinanodonta woodiana]|uniref:C1q domain-containing protein n=1 Tax=Sinanodonta woodiana TaxID=1069815 RepID=A0ABD3T654_SINWO
MLVIIALGVVTSYWSICAATIDLSSPGITVTQQDERSDVEYRELVRMLYSELKIIKEEQKAMVRVQNKLQTRVNELETKNIHLQRQLENLLISCGTEKTSESNLKSDFKLQSHGNVLESSMTNKTDKRTGKTKTDMVRRIVPTQIAFLARLTNTEFPFAHGQPVIFDNLYANLGNAYNPHNGMFRAPVAGLYIVLFTVASEVDRTPDIEIVVDGSVLCRAVVSSNIYSGSSCNAIVHLNAGDNVWARALYDHPDAKIRGFFFSTFSIGMLSSDETVQISSF